MKYATGADFRAALEARLRNEAREREVPVGRLRKIVVFDRLLARLTAVAHGRWILKGGFALELRLENRARTTKDIDLDHALNDEAAMADLNEASQHELGDFFEFQIERVAPSGLNAADIGPGGGVRFRAKAFLGGREFETALVDVGFQDELATVPEPLEGPGLLEFADIPPAKVLAAPLEQHLAEKLHAYTRMYGRDGIESTRPKDLIDIVLLAELGEYDAGKLAAAIDETFSTRDTHELPSELAVPPANWGASYAALANDVGISTDITRGYEVASALLGTLLSGDSQGRWSPSEKRWIL